MEKSHLQFCYIYTNNANITHNLRFLNINGFILETCHIYMERLIIYLHRHVSNSKFIKSNLPPEIRTAPHLNPKAGAAHFNYLSGRQRWKIAERGCQ